MTTTEFSSGRHTLATLAGTGARHLAALWTAFRNRRAAFRLLEWDDRMLRDIGLTSNDVRSALAGHLNDDPTARLGDFSNERRAAIRATARERRRGLEI